jgi:hypothetical protein
MLVEVEGERVRVLAGLAMRMRLLQILGPVRALRVVQAMTCGAQIASPSRMQPLLLSFLILLTMLLFSHNAFAYFGVLQVVHELRHVSLWLPSNGLLGSH